ncbi:MAG: hypothetical protein R2867_28640 [Caldilineaceae bacterium]
MRYCSPLFRLDTPICLCRPHTRSHRRFPRRLAPIRTRLPDDWQPDCAATELTYDADDQVWQGTFTVPAGDWEYKTALNDSWDENYGAGAVAGGDNIPLSLAAATDVKFYYSHDSHWITDNVNAKIVTAPGNFQAALGCPGDWQPDCLRSWLQDADGDGVYVFETTALPPVPTRAKLPSAKAGMRITARVA